jgi:hypothetical protein
MVAGLPLLIPDLAQTLGVLDRDVFAQAPGGIDADQDSGMFEDLLAAMDELGLKPAEVEALFTALGGVLWLGELPFVAVDTGDSNTGAGSLPADAMVLQRAALFLGTDEEALSDLLCGTDVPVAEALARRNALCAEAYDRIVQWVVGRLNTCLAACGGRHAGNTQSVALRVVDGPGLEPVHPGLVGSEAAPPAGAETFAVNYYAERMLQAMSAGPLAASYRLRAEASPAVAEQLLAGAAPADNMAIVHGLDELVAALARGVPADDAVLAACEAAGAGAGFHVADSASGRLLSVPHAWGAVSYQLDEIVAAAMTPLASLADVLSDDGPVPLQVAPSARTSLLLRPRLAGDALDAALPKSAAFFVACLRPDRPSLDVVGDSGDLDEGYAAEQLLALGVPQMIEVMRRAYPETMTAHDVRVLSMFFLCVCGGERNYDDLTSF